MRRLAVVAILVLAAVPAWASEEAASTSFLGLPRVLWYALNMVAFFGLLIYLLAKPMSHFFHSRGEDISRQIADAAREREDAARMKSEMEAKLASLETEIGALRERLRREGEREREQLERQGEAEAARMLAQLDQEAQRRVEEARTALAREAAGIAAELARELLERELTPADRERIFTRTLERLAAKAAGGER